jgi:hypothetical protein
MGLRRAWPVARLVTRQRVVLRFDQGAGAELGNAEYQRQLELVAGTVAAYAVSAMKATSTLGRRRRRVAAISID